MYESGILAQVTGGALKPGGIDLTARALLLAGAKPTDKILDLGCGMGTTLHTLEQSGCSAFGLDLSNQLIMQAKRFNPRAALINANAARFPLVANSLDLIIAECSITATGEVFTTLCECARVLRPGGRLVISDIYARKPEAVSMLRGLPFACGVSNAFVLSDLQNILQQLRFVVRSIEDHSQAISALSAAICKPTGSAAGFWSKAEPAVDPFDLQIALARAKLGYFILIATKTEK